ncbi:hypothetical protein FDB55_13090 [Clostridium botulinum]|uniref:Uncharacterized protein n=1 Tax=Clostridium botulinum TaxID=1491 RepID=A0A6M0SRK5_CLOBO|nr:hypothetical protein [Clostridium botulinum]MBY6918147.1 hypothetical protein [Clostridium botulinum]NFA43940.1 hypothetical protein [Clostridium botulinum]NFL43200.1 hypothetical protein [Clostridium botulinum]NFN14878.1 hypothetical protein [Clostridium botulinum]NFN22669.1 hypothetical protein [Clostridium botulinum]
METYGLYHNKEQCILRISKFSNSVMVDSDVVKRWNENWFICGCRKPLRVKANELLNKWKADAKSRIELLENTKIQTK